MRVTVTTPQNPPSRPAAPVEPRAAKPYEPAETVVLRGSAPPPNKHRLRDIAVAAAAVAISVTIVGSGFAGLIHALLPDVDADDAKPPEGPDTQASQQVESPWQEDTIQVGDKIVRLPVETPAPAAPAASPTTIPMLELDSPVMAPAVEAKVPASVQELTPAFFQRLGNIEYGSTKIPKGQVVLTFDDGPNPKVTPQILDTLKAHGVKGAVFFVTGQNAKAHPALIKRIVAEGHVLGDHTWSHPKLTSLKQSEVLAELQKTDAAIDKVLGYDYPTKLVRPPYGARNTEVMKTINDKYGGKSILWQVDSEDWKVQSDLRAGKETTSVQSRVMSQVKSLDKRGVGGVVLMHDIHSNTAKELGSVLKSLKAGGYKVISITDVAKPAAPAPGRAN